MPPWIEALDLDRPSEATGPSLPPRRLWPATPAIHEALRAARAALAPAAPEHVVAQLMRLRLHLPMRDVSATEARLLMEDYLADLATLPADVLAEAVAEARRSCKWFPSIAELMALARPTLQRRHALVQRLERMAMAGAPDDDEPNPVVRAHIAEGLRAVVVRLRSLEREGAP